MVGFSGRGRWRGGGGCGGPRGGRKSASFRPSAKEMGKNNPPEPDFEQPAHSTEWSGRAAGRPASRSASRFWPAGRPVGQPVFSRRPARFSAWLAGWPAGRLAVAARPGQPAAPRASRWLSRARPATPLETRPAAGHIRQWEEATCGNLSLRVTRSALARPQWRAEWRAQCRRLAPPAAPVGPAT